MGRIALLIVLGLIVVTVVFVGGSYLVVFWRDTMRRWRLEKHSDERKRIEQANEDFVKATERIKETNKE